MYGHYGIWNVTKKIDFIEIASEYKNNIVIVSKVDGGYEVVGIRHLSWMS